MRSSRTFGLYALVLAGGIESMSRMPYLIDADDARWGHKQGGFPLVDAMYRDGFFCPLAQMIMGETAELLARAYGITRDESDEYACETQARAAAAVRDGRFDAEIAPVTIRAIGPFKSQCAAAYRADDIQQIAALVERALQLAAR